MSHQTMQKCRSAAVVIAWLVTMTLLVANTNAFTATRRSVVAGSRVLHDGDFSRIKPFHAETAPRRSPVSLPNKRGSHIRHLFSPSLIDASDTWGNVAVVCGSATIAQVLGKRTKIGQLLGPPVTAMALMFVFASVGITNSGGTSSAKSLQWIALNLATPLMLLGADLRDVVSRCGPLFVSFIAASMATILASIVGWQICGSLLVNALQVDAIKIAAALLAKNIGGGINYIAVCKCLEASGPAVAAGLVVDNFFALIYFPATSALGAGKPDIEDRIDNQIEEESTALANPDPNKLVFDICQLLFASGVLLWLGERIGGASGALPCCTVLTLIAAVASPSRWLRPLQPLAEALGTSCLYLFIATVGASGIAIADSVKAAMIPLILFLTCLYGFHFMILWVLQKLLPGNRSFLTQRLLVASSAAIGGPPTAVALAQANQWKSLIVPSLLVGNIGYAIATFTALGFAKVFGR